MDFANGSEKDQALREAFASIEKQFGKGSIMKLGDHVQKDIEAIPTGAINLDVALGIGGLPRGRVIEIYGPESSGKTTLALHVVAEAQKMGGTAAFIDAEQALGICDSLVRSSAVDIIIIDSVAALVPRAEIEGNMGDSHVGLQARLMSQALRKLTGVISKSNCTVIFINQLREKVGIMFGNPEVTTGGRALKFYSSVRIEIRRGEAIRKGDDIVGNRTKVKIVKNKVAPPFKQVEFDIMYGEGISKIGTILDLATDCKVVKKAGAWYSYEEEKLGQGRENSKLFLEENPKILEEIIDKTYEFYGLRSKEDSEAIKTENNDNIKDESNNEISEDELD